MEGVVRGDRKGQYCSLAVTPAKLARLPVPLPNPFITLPSRSVLSVHEKTQQPAMSKHNGHIFSSTAVMAYFAGSENCLKKFHTSWLALITWVVGQLWTPSLIR